MIAKWGEYSHPDQEIKLKRYYKRAKINKRGLRESVVIGAFLEGWVVADTEADVASRITEIETAYAVDNRDFVMLTTAGAEGPHVIKSSHPLALTGVKVIDFQWTDHDPTELLNNRSFTVHLEGEYMDSDSVVIEYEESLEFIGDTGPAWYSKEMPVGPPIDVLLREQTVQRVIQTGHSIGLNDYIAPLGPFDGSRSHRNAKRIKPYSPVYRGAPDGNGRYSHYRLEWTYFHTFTNYTSGVPSPFGQVGLPW